MFNQINETVVHLGKDNLRIQRAKGTFILRKNIEVWSTFKVLDYIQTWG